MNIWERYVRALGRSAGAHTEGDTTYDDLQVFKAHALHQRDHISKLQSRIARQTKELNRFVEADAKRRKVRPSVRYGVKAVNGIMSDSHVADALPYVRAGVQYSAYDRPIYPDFVRSAVTENMIAGFRAEHRFAHRVDDVSRRLFDRPAYYMAVGVALIVAIAIGARIVFG